jgi:hypothetical protein
MRILFTLAVLGASVAQGEGLGGGRGDGDIFGALFGGSPLSFQEKCQNRAGEFLGNGFGLSRYGPNIKHYPPTPAIMEACSVVTNQEAFNCVTDLRNAQNKANPPQLITGSLASKKNWHFLPLNPAAVRNCGRIHSKADATCVHEATSSGYFDEVSIGFCGTNDVGAIEDAPGNSGATDLRNAQNKANPTRTHNGLVG